MLTIVIKFIATVYIHALCNGTKSVCGIKIAIPEKHFLSAATYRHKHFY